MSTNLVTMISPILADYVYIGGGFLGLILVIILVFLLLRRGR